MDISKLRPDPSRAKLVAAKEAWVEERREIVSRDGAGNPRRPPGQDLTTDWPVLDLGHQPLIDLRDWKLTVGGLVDRPLAWRWADLMAQPQTESLSDIHCVTGWSRLDNRWRGVATRALAKAARVRATARFVVIHGYDGYTTNMTLADFLAPDVLLAHDWEGSALAREHGGPLRLVAPRRYFWKSAKWVRHIVFLDKDCKGFWEARGYHNQGDPWREERYG